MPFADPDIGGVSGELVLDCESRAQAPARRRSAAAERESVLAAGLSTYWRYEKWLRRHESAVASTLGVTGAIYALRRSLWQALPPDTVHMLTRDEMRRWSLAKSQF